MNNSSEKEFELLFVGEDDGEIQALPKPPSSPPTLYSRVVHIMPPAYLSKTAYDTDDYYSNIDKQFSLLNIMRFVFCMHF